MTDHVARPSDVGGWFDVLLPRVRNLRAFLTDEQIARKLVDSGEATPEQVFLCLKSAKTLDGDFEDLHSSID